MKITNEILLTLAIVILPSLCLANTFSNLGGGDDERSDIPGIIKGPVGDIIDISSRNLTFRNEDLNVPGNAGSLPIVVSRVYDQFRHQPSHRIPFPLGNWDLEIPKITAWRSVLRSDNASFPFDAAPDVWSAGYCHNPVFFANQGESIISKLWFWTGLHMAIPGDGNRELLFATQNINGVDQVVYPPIRDTDGLKGNVTYRTTDNWKADCIDLPQGARSGFLVTSPAGLKYYFDKFASPRSSIYQQYNWDDSLGAYIFPSKIVDVHGNYLEFTYQNDPNGYLHVTKIKSNDGRVVKFEYTEVNLAGHEFWRPVNNVWFLRFAKQMSEVAPFS